MPAISDLKAYLPDSWEMFERIVLSALKIRWSITEMTRHGRSGQAQDGVDLFGFSSKRELYGVQCKHTEDLPLQVVKREVAKAERFQPKLDAYFIATTAPPNGKLQTAVLQMTKDRLKKGLFPIGLIYWEDLWQDLTRDKAELYKHYPELKPAAAEPLYHGLTFAQMFVSLANVPIECERYLGKGKKSDLLTQFVCFEQSFQEGTVSDAVGAVPPWMHFAFHHLTLPLRNRGLVEPHHPRMGALCPSFRLTEVGRAFLLRLQLEAAQLSADSAASE